MTSPKWSGSTRPHLGGWSSIIPALILLTLWAVPTSGQDVSVPRVRADLTDASTAFPYAAPTSVGLDSALVDAIADSVAIWIAGGDLVGAELLVVRDGHTVLHEALGWRDRETDQTLQLNTVFRIRSMTKPVIGTAVLMLQDEGRLSVEDRVSDHLPAFDTDASRDLRVEELLTHTSGLGDLGSEDIGLEMDPDEYETLEAVVEDIGHIGPTFPRGRFRYSSAGSATLAALVAEVTGQPVEEFLQNRIFEPLGMASTWTEFAPDSSWAGRLSSTYRWSPEIEDFERYWDPGQPQRYRYFRGSGGIYSTPADYARLLAMWMGSGVFGGQRLLSREAIDQALRTERGSHYGFHWTVPNAPPAEGIVKSFLHGGSDKTLGIAIPAERTLVLLFVQARDTPVVRRTLGILSRMDPFWPYVSAEYRGGTMHVEEFPEEVPLASDELWRYTGRFLAGETVDRPAITVDVVERDGRLMAALASGDRPGLAPRDLIHLGDDRFAWGRVMDGSIVELLSDGAALEFLPTPGEERFVQLRTVGRILARVDVGPGANQPQ